MMLWIFPAILTTQTLALSVRLSFARHGDFLRRAPNLIARWSRYLTAEQVEELSNYLEGHQGAVIGILPSDRVLPQAEYDNFFRRAREFEWLEF